MKVRRPSEAVVGILLVVVMMATSFVSPGIRHTHEGGDEGHSHEVPHENAKPHVHHDSHSHGRDSHSHAWHSHSEGGHSHSHSRAHAHGGHSQSHHDDGELAATQSHLHINFLWFELTLPDFFGGDDDSTVSSVASNSKDNDSAQSSETVVITSPFTMAQLVQLVFLSPAPLPERTKIPVGQLVVFFNPASLLKTGRLADAPLLPPPKFA